LYLVIIKKFKKLVEMLCYEAMGTLACVFAHQSLGWSEKYEKFRHVV